MPGFPWTKQELLSLRILHSRGFTAEEMKRRGFFPKRPRMGIQKQLGRLGLVDGSRAARVKEGKERMGRISAEQRTALEALLRQHGATMKYKLLRRLVSDELSLAITRSALARYLAQLGVTHRSEGTLADWCRANWDAETRERIQKEAWKRRRAERTQRLRTRAQYLMASNAAIEVQRCVCCEECWPKTKEFFRYGKKPSGKLSYAKTCRLCWSKRGAAGGRGSHFKVYRVLEDLLRSFEMVDEAEERNGKRVVKETRHPELNGAGPLGPGTTFASLGMGPEDVQEFILLVEAELGRVDNFSRDGAGDEGPWHLSCHTSPVGRVGMRSPSTLGELVGMIELG